MRFEEFEEELKQKEGESEEDYENRTSALIQKGLKERWLNIASCTLPNFENASNDYVEEEISFSFNDLGGCR